MGKRPVKYLSMREYRAFMKHHKLLSPEQRKLEDAKERKALDLGEQRRMALAKVREKFGPGEEGWRRCQEAGGCHWTTYRFWDDDTLNVQPQLRSMTITALACGIRNPNLFG